MPTQMIAQPLAHYTYTYRGFYYYRRRVPKDLAHEYRKNMIVIAMRTKLLVEAKKIAVDLTAKLDKLWFNMRFKEVEVPAEHLLLNSINSKCIILIFSDAYSLYLKVKGQNKSKSFQQSCDRAADQFIKYAGDNQLDRYARSDANGLRDKLMKQGLAPQSVKRMFSILRTIFNLAINEHTLPCPNIFTSIEFGVLKAVQKRLPVPDDNIRSIQLECQRVDDANRWLIALISDTGMRLSEALGLSVNDIILNGDTPHINLVEHKWRPLKTTNSIRRIPLVGASLWAAERIVSQTLGGKAFPQYTTDIECKGNSASAALNKWLRPHLPKHCVIHSFRHSLRDRLRAVQCPSDIIDAIGGWSGNKTTGQSYGQGYPLDVLSEWMGRI